MPGLLVLIASLFTPCLNVHAESTPIDFVDPLIDTHNSRWFYFNSACRPFGMVNLSPDTHTKGSWRSGYLYGGKNIRCFSHIHAWQLSGIPVMPIVGEMTGHKGMDIYQSEFSHDQEVVRAGYHKVVLEKYGVTTELTSTARVGFHRYSFPDSEDAYVVFDLCAMLGHGPVVRAEAVRVGAKQIEGMSLMRRTRRRKKDTPVYFVAQFSQRMTGFGGWKKGGDGKELLVDVDDVSGAESGAYVRFETRQDRPLLMKVAISYTSVEGARRNLEAELAHWDFDRVVGDSEREWNELLGRIEVEGGSDAQKTKFYTDLWHAALGRRIVSDVDGAYCDMTGKQPVVRRVPVGKDGRPLFSMRNFDALWGTHWNINVLWPLLCPEHYRAMCGTMMEMYKNGGLIPRGPSGGNYTFVMIGDASVPFMSSAYHKGIRDFDVEKALEGLVENAGPEGSRYYGGYARKPTPAAFEEYNEKGYISLQNPLEGAHGEAVSSLTLYNAYHDWCIAHMAKALGRDDVWRRFIPGADNYRNVIWPEKQSAWVRTEDGAWYSGEVSEKKGFCECSPAIATFYVPHDPVGLAELLGGPAAAARLLNSHFDKSQQHRFVITGERHPSNLIDYANQDSAGKAHYFNRIGFPWLSQKWVRTVHKEAFSGTDPYSGYNGDEDQGQIGALSALMAMGLFQFDGGAGPDSKYDITAPVFDRVTIHLSPRYYAGKTFTIIAENQGPENIYIQSARLNGEPFNASLLPHAELVKGGVLELVLGAEPNTSWGNAD